MEVESLSSILSNEVSTGETTTPPVVEPTPEPKLEPTVDKTVEPSKETRDEQGRFAKPAEEKPALTKADVAAIMDERRKRQEAERELAQLRQGQTPKPKTDIFENPDVAFDERFREQLGPLQNQIMKLEVELAKTKMPDFDDAALAFFNVAQNDPVLRHQADTAPDPYQFIYREGKRLKELGDVGGDILKYREKVTAEARAEIAKRDEQIKTLTDQMAALQKTQAELSAIPRSLNTTQSGQAPRISDTSPDDIKSLVRFGNKPG